MHAGSHGVVGSDRLVVGADGLMVHVAVGLYRVGEVVQVLVRVGVGVGVEVGVGVGVGVAVGVGVRLALEGCAGPRAGG